MSSVRCRIAVLFLASLAAGCGNEEAVTTFPTTTATPPPEADQMKNDMMKRFAPKGVAGSRKTAPSEKKGG